MTYRYEEPQSIHVTADELGTPQAFTYRNVHHQVDQVTERYRVDTGWWDQRTWREIFQVITVDGLLVGALGAGAVLVGREEVGRRRRTAMVHAWPEVAAGLLEAHRPEDKSALPSRNA